MNLPFVIASPTTLINIPTVMAITTHTLAILLESVKSFFSSLNSHKSYKNVRHTEISDSHASVDTIEIKLKLFDALFAASNVLFNER